MQKATIGGILSIVASSIGILIGCAYLIYPIFMSSIINSLEEYPGFVRASPEDSLVVLIWVIFGAMFLFQFLIGALGIAGGICAIKKKAWGMALAGAIASSMSFYYIGIAAVVLVSMAQPEFIKRIVPAAVSPSTTAAK